METYRLSSKLRDKEREYTIQTSNDSTIGAVATAIYVDGVLTETVHNPHPTHVSDSDVLALVKTTHNEKKQEIEGLLQSFQQVLRSGDSALMYQLALPLFYRGFFREAAELLEQSIRGSRDMHQALNLLGQCYLALGSIDLAVAAATRAVDLRPTFADYRNNLGEAFLANGNGRKALEQFDAAIEINLYYADAYFNRGLALLLIAVADGASDSGVSSVADAFRKASLLLPEYGGSLYDAGVTSLKESHPTRALQAFKALRETRQQRYRAEMAQLHTKVTLRIDELSEKALGDRIAHLHAEISRNPLYPDLQAELAQCYIEQARLACRKATDHFRKASELNPSLSHYHTAYDQAEDVLQRLSHAAGRRAEKG